jgi:hypothetical protein
VVIESEVPPASIIPKHLSKIKLHVPPPSLSRCTRWMFSKQLSRRNSVAILCRHWPKRAVEIALCGSPRRFLIYFTGSLSCWEPVLDPVLYHVDLVHISSSCFVKIHSSVELFGLNFVCIWYLSKGRDSWMGIVTGVGRWRNWRFYSWWGQEMEPCSTSTRSALGPT